MLLLLGVLAVAWLLWSGIYKPVVLGLGAFSCVVTLFLARQMGFFDHSSEFHRIIWRLPGYWLWLVQEIVKSSWDVARLVLSPSLPIDPVVVRLKTGVREELGQTILGNSITLSPGTVTLDIHEQELLVHCIDRRSAEALLQGEVDRRVQSLEPES
ncbi:MAG: Na+/H+ antiporter subunit E [Proteobacteria bacterium]|nr:Na+/H+ antiporter subunit E [Pseudomonadota bacterium]